MKVSVIVPVYNLEHYIGPCLESLVTQDTTFDFEVIVANDCSTDNSLNVIRHYLNKFPSIIKLIDNKMNQRLAKNMRLLLAEARGDYIAYVDGDDLALPGKLQQQAEFLDVNQDCGMVYHDSEVFDSDTGNVTGFYVRDYYNRQYIPEKSDITHVIRYGSYFQASSLMIKRHDHLKDTVDDQCKIILDQPFQVLNAGYLGNKIGRIDATLGRYRLHANSFGAKTLKDFSRREQVLSDQLQAVSNGAKFDVDPDVINQGRSHYYLATAMYFLKLQEEALFRKYLALSALEGWYFDERHKYLLANQSDLNACYSYITGA